MLEALLEINISGNKILMRIILAYSAIKIRANPSLPYSTLKPETSSDSPSAKSNGVRFVSAMQEINHTADSGTKIRHFNQSLFIEHLFKALNLPTKDRNTIITKANLTS